MSEKPTYEELEQRVKELKETALKCKPAEEALIEREKRYRFILENVTDVIWIVDMEMKFTYYSPSVKKMRGYSGRVQEAMVQTYLVPDNIDYRPVEIFEDMVIEILGVATTVIHPV